MTSLATEPRPEVLKVERMTRLEAIGPEEQLFSMFAGVLRADESCPDAAERAVLADELAKLASATPTQLAQLYLSAYDGTPVCTDQVSVKLDVRGNSLTLRVDRCGEGGYSATLVLEVVPAVVIWGVGRTIGQLCANAGGTWRNVNSGVEGDYAEAICSVAHVSSKEGM